MLDALTDSPAWINNTTVRLARGTRLFLERAAAAADKPHQCIIAMRRDHAWQMLRAVKTGLPLEYPPGRSLPGGNGRY